MSEVLYKEIPNYPGYKAGDDGSIWSCKRGYWRKLNPYINVNGYCEVNLRKDGKSKVHQVQTLILISFIGPRPISDKKIEACHNNGISTDNRLVNLRWDTCENNNADKVKHGTYIFGEKCTGAKLTDEQAIEIINRANAGERNCDLADEFGISDQRVCDLKNGRTKVKRVSI